MWVVSIALYWSVVVVKLGHYSLPVSEETLKVVDPFVRCLSGKGK